MNTDAFESTTSAAGADYIASLPNATGARPASATRLEFQGLSGRECEAFITAVSRRAFNEGKEQDDRWTAAFASSCFAFDALRWLNELDDEIQGSWKQLRRAMLTKYRTIAQEELGPTASSKARGRIRVVSWGLSRVYYLSKKFDTQGRFTISTSADDALIVSYDMMCRTPQKLLIAADQTKEYDQVCVVWHAGNTSWAHNWSGLGAINSLNGKRSFTGSYWNGPLVTEWNVTSHPTSRSWRLTISEVQGQEPVFAGSRGEGSEIWFQPEPTQSSLTTDLFVEPI